MNKVKFIMALFAASAGLLLAAAPKFSIKITPVKTVYKLGEKIEFDLEVTHPENYQLKAWQPTISKLGSPAGFEQKWNKWGSINLDPVHWIPKAAAEKNTIRCGFVPGKNFIPGDYNFGIVVRLYPDGNTAKNPKLLSGRLNITLEAPASAAADAAKTAGFPCSLENISTKTAKAADGGFTCTTQAKAVNSSENGACFLVKAILTGADGKIAAENSSLIGVRGKEKMPVKFSTAVKNPGKYVYAIELWSNESTPVLHKTITSDIVLQ